MDEQQLSSEIIDAINEAESHLPYIVSALAKAREYAESLRFTESVSQEQVSEGFSHLHNATNLSSLLADANEAALELRRAGDVAANNHYG